MGINYDVEIDIGAAGTPFYVRSNSFTVTSNAAGLNSYGIRLRGNNIFAEITGNDMTGGNGIWWGNDAWGIYIQSDVSLGSSGNPFLVDSNLMTVTATNNDAYGILLSTPDNIFVDITNNEMTGGVTGGNNAYGIYPGSLNDIFADITLNTSVNVTADVDAWGAYIVTLDGVIGNSSRATNFFLNSGTIDGNLNRYMLGLYKNSAATGSNVVWGIGPFGNVFTSLDGGVGANWSGNYDAGDSLPAPGGVNKPVEANFTAGDTISP